MLESEVITTLSRKGVKSTFTKGLASLLFRTYKNATDDAGSGESHALHVSRSLLKTKTQLDSLQPNILKSMMTIHVLNQVNAEFTCKKGKRDVHSKSFHYVLLIQLNFRIKKFLNVWLLET